MTARLCTVLLALALGGAAVAQTSQKPAGAPQTDARASAYYNFAMGHIYSELAGMHGYRSEYVDKAIEHYKAAMRADPSASFLSEELTDLYMQSGKLRDAVTEAEDMLKRNPDNLEARRMLGRIYSRMIGDQQTNRINETMLHSAIEQYTKIAEKDPKDLDAWLMLGRLHKLGQNSVDSEKAYKQALEIDPKNEFALTGLALVYSDLGDSTHALEMWRRLSDQHPSPRTLRALANAYEQAHDYKSAAQTLRRALDLDPRNTEILKSLAENLLLSDDVDGALKLYQQALEADPKDPRLYVRLSQIYRQKKDFAKAREAQEHARELDPDNLEILYNDVNLLEAEGKIPESIARLKGILDTTSRRTYSQAEQANRVIFVERLGLLYRQNEQFGEAVQMFEQMPQLDADSAPRAAAQVVDTWRQAKDFAKAEQAATEAQKKWPDNRTLTLVRASLLADLGRVDEAVAGLKKLPAGQNDRENQLALAQIYDKGKRFEEEAAALDAAEKLSQEPEDRETVLFMRGAMFEKMKKPDLAEEQFRKVLAINPANASALNYLGYMLADRNVRLEEAHQMITRALELEPNNGAYLDSLGWVNYRLGKLEDAENQLRAAITRVSRDPVVHDHLGDVYFKQGKLKEAIAEWERSLKEWDVSSRSEYDPAEVAKVQKKLEGARVRLAKETPKTPPERR